MKSMINYLNDNNSAHDLISVIDSILGACLEISLQVAQGELSGMLGSTTEQNVQGETQKKLDVISNDILKSSLLKNEFVKTLASEEEDFVVPVAENGSYVVAFDPLDGSSNIDINGQIGTIFTIYKAKVFEPAFSELQFAQQGHQQVCAGYVLYGASTLLVMSIGGPTQMFTLDRTQNEFILSDKKVDISNGLDEFSVNTSNYSQWSPQFQQYVGDLMAGSNGKRSKKFNMRWNGSMVGDVHRVLYRGGIFCYPSDVTDKSRSGKLRLLYEANPMAFLVEHANGKANTEDQRILDIHPHDIHQRVPVILGSSDEVDMCMTYLNPSK